ncbi:uncharacterized protein LOC113472811 [Diaphorina citri]|uniref:Odorant receptor n=1 Tax=Diaphorina citri TaxID=121845 RepID=A0A3Q0JML3_DIACI|nr:uncharacterized protein LOC113472811 [Diaphorina citri]KAI5753587.1 hypothetical protein M8J77_001612 [Diaphorina citri]
MKFPSPDSFKSFIILHYAGLYSLPNHHRQHWLNIVQFCYSCFAYICMGLFSISITLNVFIYAIHDTAEFLQRLFEMIGIVAYTTQIFITNIRLTRVFNMYALMGRTFTISDVSIYEKHKAKESRIMKCILCLCVGMWVTLLAQPFVDPPERVLVLMKSVYHAKPPYRRLPVLLWLPFIDINDWTVYSILYMLEAFASTLFFSALYQVVNFEVMFSTPLAGQFEMLSQFITMIGGQHQNSVGQRIYYTDIRHNISWTESQLDTWDRTKPYGNLRKEMMKTYEVEFVRQVIRRHQELVHFKNEYQKFIASLLDVFGICPTLLMTILSVYQIAYMEHLPITQRVTILIEFIFINVGYLHLTLESEKLDDCNRRVVQSLIASEWYRCSPDTRRCLLMTLRQAQMPGHLRFMCGLVRLDLGFMINVLRFSLTFVNFVMITLSG